MKLLTLALLPAAALLVAIMVAGCRQGTGSPSTNNASAVNASSDRGDPFDNFLRAAPAPADGFDFPIGDPDGKGSYTDKATGLTHNGWYIATRFTEKYSMGIHTGEDWNSGGGGDAGKHAAGRRHRVSRMGAGMEQ